MRQHLLALGVRRHILVHLGAIAGVEFIAVQLAVLLSKRGRERLHELSLDEIAPTASIDLWESLTGRE
ncbi:hypothetical protein BC828DRAFT_381522 [Blastocladiella britannica]|nr:hypothetical protein BC828DRAFT_381522 [Blastocladiella britannica]